MSAVVGLIGIILALVIFLVAVYKGFSSYWVAPVYAIIVAVFNRMAPDQVIAAAPAVARVGALAATTFETLPINGLII